MIHDLTTEQLESRLSWVEGLIQEERDPKNLPYHNAMYQKLIDELARRDVEESLSNSENDIT